MTNTVVPPPGYRELIEQVKQDAGVHGNMPALMKERRLRPHVGTVFEWVFRRLAQQCWAQGVRPVLVYRPATIDPEGSEPRERAEMIRLARKAGLEIIDLSPAYAAIQDRNSLVLARWDDHTTALGHRLLAETLHEKLVALLSAAPAPGGPTALKRD